jgi:hypothetical protein
VDAEGLHLNGKRVGEPFDRMFAHHVGARVRAREDSRHGAGRRDAASLGDDQRRKRLCDAPRAGGIDRHGEIELVLWALEHGSCSADAGIVDQTVEAAASLLDRRDRGVDVFLFGDIQAQGLDVLDHPERHEVGVFARAGIDKIALRRQAFGDPSPDPCAGARDEHGLLGPCW